MTNLPGLNPAMALVMVLDPGTVDSVTIDPGTIDPGTMDPGTTMAMETTRVIEATFAFRAANACCDVSILLTLVTKKSLPILRDRANSPQRILSKSVRTRTSKYP